MEFSSINSGTLEFIRKKCYFLQQLIENLRKRVLESKESGKISEEMRAGELSFREFERFCERIRVAINELKERIDDIPDEIQRFQASKMLEEIENKLDMLKDLVLEVPGSL
ncbi:MAG: hypothetical protein ACTSX9_04865 [Candidatus Njordarchaeales archaeon]